MEYSAYGVCRCCLANGSFKRLAHEYQWLGDKEIYIVMLQECFGLNVVGGDESERLICEVCITRLRDAANFKKQVMVSEKYFQMSVGDSSSKETPKEIPRPMPSAVKVKKEELDDDYNSAAEETVFAYEVPVKVEEAKSEPDDEEPLSAIRGRNKRKQTRKNKAEASTSAQADTIGWRHSDEHADEKVTVTLTCETLPIEHSASDHANDNKQKGVNKTECVVDVKLFNCTECGQGFKSEQGMKNHRARTHKDTYVRIHECAYCKERFPRIFAKYKHIRTVHPTEINNGMGGYPCGACDKIFLVKYRLRMHQRRMHLLERQYACSLCDFRCFLKSALADHMLTHTGGKKVACGVCNKLFAREKALILHMRIHNDDKRAVCKVCERAFVQRASLTYHMAKHHPSVPF